jgi:Bacterial membrane protein YfhO
MQHRASWLLVLVCLAAAMAACYGRALRGEQFGYRDSAHYYYPLHQRVQTEWEARRWPLWEPEENSGMPLMGNPTAAVLYPGKLIFAVAPYPMAARLYVIAHTLIAFLSMCVLMRGLGTGVAGSALAAVAYAFGGPILFQYCNIIYLVGAAWAPLGLHAADSWLRLGRRSALLELAVVLALETLGGDPEIAYLTGLCAGGYALMLIASTRPPITSARRLWIVLGAAAGVVVWVVATLALASVLPGLRPERPAGQPTAAFAWMPWVGPAVVAAWGAAGLRVLLSWKHGRVEGKNLRLVPMLAGLAAAAVLAGLLAGAQLLPVFEFTGMSVRAAGEGPHEIYTFSLHPLRIVEFLWPNVFGTPFHGNRQWSDLLPIGNLPAKIWVPSIYLGGLTLVLALGSFSSRRDSGAPWRRWLGAVAVISLLASFGEYTGPLWWARFQPSLTTTIGPHDPQQVAPIRFDKELRDGDGSVYWTLATVLPGFKQFRFPSKLLTLTALALTALAGQGLDRLLAGDRRVRNLTAATAGAGLVLSLAALGLAFVARPQFLAWLRSQHVASTFGPLDPAGAWSETTHALVHGAVIFGVALALALSAARRPRLVAALALVVTTGDVVVANARYVLTVPQADFDKKSELLSIIEAAEKADPSPSPYRVHRLPAWSPILWIEEASADRVRDFVAWEHDTLQPKHGINDGVNFTMTLGVAELYDYEWFFGGFYRTVEGRAAKTLGLREGQKVVAYSRRAFDIWSTRYFILPSFAADWKEEHRGYATFLQDSERIYPRDEDLHGATRAEKEENWAKTRDVQVFRNLTAYPRAWVVHEQRVVRAIQGFDRDTRNIPMQEILYSNDYLWQDGARTVYDPRRIVWIEPEDRLALGNFASGGPTDTTETVKVTRNEPQRVELSANLERPGVVVLADVYYPGWSLTIDGRPAPIYRANWMMRGAAVPSGKHTLVYTFHPRSFHIGLALSTLGLAFLAGSALVCAARPSWRVAEWGALEPRES